MITLSAPSMSGYKADFAETSDAREKAAEILGVSLDEMVEVDMNDITYCYASQIEADADQDGAYAVKYNNA